MRAAILGWLVASTAACAGTTESASIAAKVVFVVQPTKTTVDQAITPEVQVAIEDNAGMVVASGDPVSIELEANPGGATLVGTTTVNAVNGVAHFGNLAVHQAGRSYSLLASSGGLLRAGSTGFDVLLGLVAVSSGAGHVCAVTDRGAAYCWGNNYAGKLGDGTTTDRLVPTPVTGGLKFADIGASGGDHTCALTTDGVTYCWGSDGVGQLGAGSIGDQNTPTQVSGGLTFTRLDVGGLHNCALTAGGAAYCWGSNSNGQIGSGAATTVIDTPTMVSGSLTFVALSAGFEHTCGLTVDGAAYCWGRNVYGQVGDGTETDRAVPVPVSGGLRFAAITAGFDDTCGLTASGTAYCWGGNPYGEVGDGTTVSKDVPTPVSGGLAFTSLSTGDDTCALTSSGAAYCWGFNQQGQLGNGSTTDSSVPVAVSGGLTFAMLSVSPGYACGLGVDGSAYCWGSNVYGQFGTGTTNWSNVPVPTPGS